MGEEGVVFGGRGVFGNGVLESGNVVVTLCSKRAVLHRGGGDRRDTRKKKEED